MNDLETYAAVVADLSRRLRPVCDNWPDDVFQAMVERLANITLKYDGLASGGTYDRRTTDRLVDELRNALERSERARANESESGSARGDESADPNGGTQSR